jgi:hypothetical protein
MTKQPEVDTSELDALFPEPEIVTVVHGDSSVSIAVPVLDYGQIASILKIIAPLLKAATDENYVQFVLNNAAEAGETLAIALRRPIAYVNRMPPNLIAACLAALVRKNQDFFEREVRPLLPGQAPTASPEASPKP